MLQFSTWNQPGPNKAKIFFFHVLMRWFFSRFPQYNLPTFRIDQSGCLKKVRIGEEISLVRLVADYLFVTLLLTFNIYFIVTVANLFIRYLEERVKVPWPVSEREALLHYFELEYLKEDLVIVIMKTVRMFFPFIFFSFLRTSPYNLDAVCPSLFI